MIALVALGVATFISVVIGVIIAVFGAIGALVVFLVQDSKEGSNGNN